MVAQRQRQDRDSSPRSRSRSRGCPLGSAVLDGEVVGFDERLISRFQLLQRGGTPLVYAVFDCLSLDGRDLRKRPLVERRAALEALVGNHDRLFPSRQLARNGLGAYRTAVKRGYEGVVGKELASVYTSGRSTEVAQGEGPPGGGVRRRGVHASGGRPLRLRSAPPRRVPGQEAPLRREGGSGILGRPAEPAAEALRPVATGHARVRPPAAGAGRDVARSLAMSPRSPSRNGRPTESCASPCSWGSGTTSPRGGPFPTPFPSSGLRLPARI